MKEGAGRCEMDWILLNVDYKTTQRSARGCKKDVWDRVGLLYSILLFGMTEHSPLCLDPTKRDRTRTFCSEWLSAASFAGILPNPFYKSSTPWRGIFSNRLVIGPPTGHRGWIWACAKTLSTGQKTKPGRNNPAICNQGHTWRTL